MSDSTIFEDIDCLLARLNRDVFDLQQIRLKYLRSELRGTVSVFCDCEKPIKCLGSSGDYCRVCGRNIKQEIVEHADRVCGGLVCKRCDGFYVKTGSKCPNCGTVQT